MPVSTAVIALTSTALMVGLVVLAVGVPVALAVALRRWSRGWGRAVVAVVGVLVCQTLAIAAAGVAANDQFGFYNSWADLLGGNQIPIPSPATSSPRPKNQPHGHRVQPARSPAKGAVPYHREGKLVTLSVPLPANVGRQGKSRSEQVLVWLPRQYEQPQYRSTRFPVVVMMPGQPSTPNSVLHQFDFAAQATQAIEQHRVKPFVAVFPPIMIDPPRDTECTNVPSGPQAETWLYQNVRTAVVKAIRVTTDGRQWSAMGWSTGGFCAAKLLLRHPALFHAAAGFGAYYDAETDKTTGDLFGGSQTLRNQNAPIWLIRQPRRSPARLLIIVSRQDRDSYSGRFYADTKQMITTTKGIPGVAAVVLPTGAHRNRVYRPTVPRALIWLAKNAGL